MTVATELNRKDYVATGGTTYAHDFLIFAGADLEVYVGGALKTLTTDYTVTGAGNPAGASRSAARLPPGARSAPSRR